MKTVPGILSDSSCSAFAIGLIVIDINTSKLHCFLSILLLSLLKIYFTWLDGK